MGCAVKEKGESVLYASLFGTGYLAVSSEPNLKKAAADAVCQLVKFSGSNPCNFMEAEILATAPPRLCPGCNACKFCKSFQGQNTYLDHQRKLKMESCLTLDVAAKTWTAAYPFIQSPSMLKDNKAQVTAIGERDRAKRIKSNQFESWMVALQECIDRGVYTPATEEELKYTGPVFYSTLVTAHKPDSESTPFRLCQNSSLKYLGISLNDCLLPPPQPDHLLFDVLIRFRGYICGVASDLKKFYNTVHS